jgi:hypothetical protein
LEYKDSSISLTNQRLLPVALNGKNWHPVTKKLDTFGY